MCSGRITRYGCGHESRAYYYVCPDRGNEQYEAILPHRLVGRRIRSARLCADCERSRNAAEIFEQENRQFEERRAKALLEFLRGERPWPRTDAEMSAHFRLAYDAGERLHPWHNHGDDWRLELHRNSIVQYFPETGIQQFQEMLDRQADIDRTNRPIGADDSEFRFSRLTERGRAFAAETRRRQQEAHAELRVRHNSVQNALRNREQTLQRDERLLRLGGDYAQATEERERAILQQPFQAMAQARVDEQALSQGREGIFLELQGGNLNIEDNTDSERAMQQPGTPQDEYLNGLFQSDPEWLLSFDDWCADNSAAGPHFTEVDLRRDINGWFQHLRSCESQARLDWIPFAESYRDAILAGDRKRYQYTPIPSDWEPLSFRHWCIESADPAEILISPMSQTFINLLQGYTEYLISTECFDDLTAFQHGRSTRVKLMRDHFSLIPGAPLCRTPRDIPMMNDVPSNWQMCEDIGRLAHEGGLTTQAEILRRHAQTNRLYHLADEAEAVREGLLAGFRIEREEREATAIEVGREQEEIDASDHDLSNELLARQVYRIRGRAAGEERQARRRTQREQEDENESVGAFTMTMRIPAAIQNAIDELQSGAPLAGENLSQAAGRTYDVWQMAATQARTEDRARREAQDDQDT